MSSSSKNKKEGKNIIISTRLTESEYMNFLLKITDESGCLIIKTSAYLRAAVIDMSINIIDSEVECYKCFIAGKISNNINQIAKRLNQDHKQEKMDNDTYQAILNELKKVNDVLSNLLTSLIG